MRKRFLALLTGMAMLCQAAAFLPVCAEASPVGYVLQEGFDDGEDPFFDKTGVLDCGIIKEPDGNNGNNVYKTTYSASGNDGPATLKYPEVTFSENENIQVVSFDIKLDKQDYFGHIILRSSVMSVVYSIVDGYIIADLGNLYTNASDIRNRWYVPYDEGDWYTLTTVFNRQTKEIMYYANGKGYGMSSFGAEFPADIRYIQLQRGSADGSNTMYIDNIEYGYEETIPRIQTDCEINFICDELGQAFWDKEVEFGIEIKNNTDTEKTYDVSTEIISDLGETEILKTDIAEIEAGASSALNYKASLSRFGLYNVGITVIEKETDTEYTYNTQIVTMKKSAKQNPRLGIIDHSADELDGYGRFEEKLDYIKNMGMSAIRTELAWSRYETELGKYEIPTHCREVFDSIKKHNLDLFLIMGWNNNKLGVSDMPPNTENDLALFGDYVYNLLGDTKDYAYGYEAWNEWNVTESFNTERLTGEQYVPFIKNIYENVEEAKNDNKANPNAKIYGLSGLTWNRNDIDIYGKYSYQTMAEDMFANGVASYCDGFSMHTYAHKGGPDDGSALECIDFTRGLMKKYGAEDKELIITEMGWQAENEYYPDYDTEDIASWVAKYSAMVYDKVDRMYWYNAQRKKRPHVGTGEQSYGWMQDEISFNDYVPYQPLPQFRAMSNYNSYIADAISKEEIVLSDNVTMYRFKKADNTEVYMGWTKDGCTPEIHTFALDADYAIVSDLYGNETNIDISDRQLTLTLTNEPQYITGGFDSNTFGDETLSVLVMNSSGEVCVSGNIGNADERLGVMVKKGGEVRYINQVKSDELGNYTLTFPVNKEHGVYNLSVGTLDRDTPLTLNFNIEAFDIEILNGDKAVEEMADVKAGDIITINAAKKVAVSNPSVIVGQYNADGMLVGADILECAEGQQIQIKNDTVDKIRVYVWSIVDMAPLDREITIE